MIDKLLSRKILFINFIYSVILLLHHADADIYFSNIVQTGSWIDSVAHQINVWLERTDGIYYFMMLSAFLLYHDLSGNNVRDKLKRRIRTLMIPWLVWNLIGLISYHDFNQGIGYLLRSYFTSRFCPQIIYVEALIILLLFIPLFRRIFKMKYVREFVLIAVYVIIYWGVPHLQTADFWPSELLRSDVTRVLVYVPVYCLGVYLGLNYAEFVISEEYNNRHRNLSLVTALLVIVIPYVFQGGFIGYALGNLQFAGIWIILSKKYFTFAPGWWMHISFYMYVIHNFVLYWEGKAIRMSGLFAQQLSSSTVTESFALMWRIMLSAVAIPLIIMSAKILIRFTPKFYGVLSGGKMPSEDR